MNWKVLKEMFKTMGNGLSAQNLGDLMSTDMKLKNLDRTFSFENSNDDRRIVFTTGEKLQRTALDFSIECAHREGALLEILCTSENDNSLDPISEILPILNDSNLDFQVTRRRSDMIKAILNHVRFRQDILYFVCGTNNAFKKRWNEYKEQLSWQSKLELPSLLLVDEIIIA